MLGIKRVGPAQPQCTISADVLPKELQDAPLIGRDHVKAGEADKREKRHDQGQNLDGNATEYQGARDACQNREWQYRQHGIPRQGAGSGFVLHDLSPRNFSSP